MFCYFTDFDDCMRFLVIVPWTAFCINFVGKTPFTALNLMMPVIMAIGTLGFMIGTGGNAVASINLGEKNSERTNQYFSFLLYVVAGAGIVLSFLGFLFVRLISIFRGVDHELLKDCILNMDGFCSLGRRCLFCRMFFKAF